MAEWWEEVLNGFAGNYEEDKPKPKKNYRQRIKQILPELSGPTRAAAKATLRTSRALPRADRKALLRETLTQLPSIAAQEAMIRSDQKAARKKSQKLAEWLTQQNQPIIDRGIAQAASIRALIPQMDAAYKPILEAEALNRENSSRQMAESLVNSFSLEPQIEAWERQNALAAQLGGNYAYSGGGGGKGGGGY